MRAAILRYLFGWLVYFVNSRKVAYIIADQLPLNVRAYVVLDSIEQCVSRLDVSESDLDIMAEMLMLNIDPHLSGLLMEHKLRWITALQADAGIVDSRFRILTRKLNG